MKICKILLSSAKPNSTKYLEMVNLM